MLDLIVIGAGPAGISASLYAKRANKDVLVFYHGVSQLEKAHKIDNYYGFVNGISGSELYENGIEQAKALGVDVKNEEVLSIESDMNSGFIVKTKLAEYSSKAIVLASGSKKLRPNIKGIVDYEGRGVSYCAICDGFFYRKKNVAIIGNGNYALSEAEDLRNIVNEITIFTNGLEAPKTDLSVVTDKIAEIKGEMKVSSIVLESGEEIPIDGVFIAQGVAGGADFAKKLGVAAEGDRIKVNEKTETNLPGFFACGDLTGNLLQVCKAVYEGAQAGLSAVEYLKTKE